MLNGEQRSVRGGFGMPAEIFVNDKPSSLTTILKPGDEIVVNPAKDGENANARISDIIPALDSPIFYFSQ